MGAKQLIRKGLRDVAAGLLSRVRAGCLKEGSGPSRERAQRIASESWEARVAEIRRHVEDALLRISAAARRGSGDWRTAETAA